jgi:hypothetical protein
MKKLVFVLSAVVWGTAHSSSCLASNYHVYQKFELACPAGTERCRCPNGTAAVWICCRRNQACRCSEGEAPSCRKKQVSNRSPGVHVAQPAATPAGEAQATVPALSLASELVNYRARTRDAIGL